MKKDVINAFINGQKPDKLLSKETLNHKELIEYVTGLSVYKQTSKAFLTAYEKLGIDIINRVPEENASLPLLKGEIKTDGDYKISYLGVYNTVCREKYPFSDPDEVLECDDFNLDYNKLITPVPHRLDLDTILRKEKIVGDIGIYYYMYYTTLFMWGVEWLGWEAFMLSYQIDPVRFNEVFLTQAFEQSKTNIELLTKTGIDFVFLHDDLCDKRGPVFSPTMYDTYIFPKYQELFKIIKDAGKKIILTADGNTECFLNTYKELGVDGVMLENPATDFDKILEVFQDRIIIGGIDTNLLTVSSPNEVYDMTKSVIEKTKDVQAFAISSCGGLHGNIPLENLKAYFKARDVF